MAQVSAKLLANRTCGVPPHLPVQHAEAEKKRSVHAAKRSQAMNGGGDNGADPWRHAL